MLPLTLFTDAQSREGIGKRLYDSIGRALGRNKLNDLEQQMQEDTEENDAQPGQSREDRKKETLRKRIASMTLKKKSKISQVGVAISCGCGPHNMDTHIISSTYVQR